MQVDAATHRRRSRARWRRGCASATCASDAAGRASGTAAWRPAPGGGALVLDLLGFDLDLARASRRRRPVAARAADRATPRRGRDRRARRCASATSQWSAEPTLAHRHRVPGAPLPRCRQARRRAPRRPDLDARAARRGASPLAPKIGAAARARRRAAGRHARERSRCAPDATPIAAWRALADSPLDAWPESLAIETRVAGAEVALAGAESLRELGAPACDVHRGSHRDRRRARQARRAARSPSCR